MTADAWMRDGKQWQRHVIQVLNRHYGADDFQEVPDDYKGDYGIEGFSVSDACVYQCYAPKQLMTEAELHNHQRDKINGDLNKFVKNIATIRRMVGSPIRRWILVVPHHGSAPLVDYCAKKREELLSMNLADIDPEFRVQPKELEVAWRLEDAEIRRGLAAYDAVPREPENADVERWSHAHTVLLTNLRTKVTRLTAAAQVDDLVSAHIVDHIAGQNTLELIRTQAGHVYQRLESVRAAFEHRLKIRCALQGADARGTYLELVNEFGQMLREQCPTLAPATIERVKAQAVADWLMRCPLYFTDRNVGN